MLDTSQQPDEDDEGGSEDDGEKTKVRQNSVNSYTLRRCFSLQVLNRRKGNVQKIEATMTTVVKEAVNTQRESDTSFLRWRKRG